MRKRVSLFILVLVALLAAATVASARPPEPTSFTTIGYTTNLDPLPVPPYLVPKEFAQLPGGLIKFRFHFEAQGGNESPADDQLCRDLYGPVFYPYPVTNCADVCRLFGGACGAAGYFNGSFSFDEWGIADPTGAGANYGNLEIKTAQGDASLRFGGKAVAGPINSLGFVTGGYKVIKGTQDYKDLKNKGSYAGNAGLTFRVQYDPCNECKGGVTQLTLKYTGPAQATVEVKQKDGTSVFGPAPVSPGASLSLAGKEKDGKFGSEITVYTDGTPLVIKTDCSQLVGPGAVFGSYAVLDAVSKDNGPICPVGRCAVFGDDWKLDKDKIEWKLSNEGESALTISSVSLFWPEGNPPLRKVKLDNKTIFDQNRPAPAAEINADWSGTEKDRRIDAGKTEPLKFEFEKDGLSKNDYDFTVLVEFAEGCAVPFVAFPPAP